MNRLEEQALIDIVLATTEQQIRSCFQVMQQLRLHLTDEQALVQQVQRQIKEGYHLVCLREHNIVRACAGYRFLEFLAWGKVLYIDDLISDATTRKQGHGSGLLKWVIHQARAAQCDQVHLDSGPQRHDAHRLYLTHRFKIIGHHFALNLKEHEI